MKNHNKIQMKRVSLAPLKGCHAREAGSSGLTVPHGAGQYCGDEATARAALCGRQQAFVS